MDIGSEIKKGARLKPSIAPLSKVFDLATYAHEKAVVYTLFGFDRGDAKATLVVQIPISIAWRIHYLGRAFDGQAIKSIQPSASVVVSFTQLQLLRSELDVVSKAINEPVSRHYLELLLALLAKSSANPASCLRVDAP